MLWGAAFSAQKEASVLNAFVIGSARGILAAIFLLLMIPLLDKFLKNERGFLGKTRRGFFDFNKTEIFGGIACGVVLSAANAFQQFGINDGTDAGKAAFITALYVVIVPILALLFGKRSAINVWISIAIAVVGFYLLCIKDGFSAELSDMLVLICAFIFAAHIIVIDKFAPSCDGVRLSCIQFFVTFIINTALALLLKVDIDFQAIGEVFPSLIYLGICSSGIAYTLQIVGQSHVPPATASIVLSLESVFGVIFAAVIHGERMSLREYIGCAIVFAAVMLSQIDFKKKANKISKKDN